jgi:hypothetical protein
VLRVHLPSLAVDLTRHRYTWVADDDRLVRLRHAFADRESVPLTVDHHGVAVDFADLLRRGNALVA